MHGMHARLPKNYVLEERLETYADAIEVDPQIYAGHWAQACYPSCGGSAGSYQHVVLDLGCGKGAFCVQSAINNPEMLYIGVDGEPICIARSAQNAIEAGVRNAVFVPGIGMDVTKFFGYGELAHIYLNFSTPYPRKKDAHLRLTNVEHLMAYRDILASNGIVSLRTDSYPLREFTLTQLKIAGYTVVWQSDNARADRPDYPMTEYEERLSAQGAKVYAIDAVAGPRPSNWEQTASLSLIDYLPDDLEHIGYVPYGMEGAVTNLRNLERKGRPRTAGR